MSEQKIPFSARHRGQNQRIGSSFPESARIAILHILFDLEEKSYISGWPAVARELQRIGREQPSSYHRRNVKDLQKAKTDVNVSLFSLSWEKVLDFCERLHSHLSQDVQEHIDFEEYDIKVTRSEVQTYIAEELERLFLEENLAFEFCDGQVIRRGRRHTEEKASRAQFVLGDNRLVDSRKHYLKALNFFRHPTEPDYENCVKEAVCSVEAAGKSLFPSVKAKTLGDLIKWFKSSKEYEIPKALAKTFEDVYAFRSGGDGIGHGGARGGVATVEVAEYVLGVTASQIIYLVDIEKSKDQIPF